MKKNATGDPPKKKGPKPGTPRKRFLTQQPELVRRMHEEHLKGKNLSKLEDKYGYVDGNIKKAFERLGLEVRIVPKAGCFVKTLRRLTDDELTALARRQKRVCTPKEIKWFWRGWPMAKRAWFIGQIRAHLKSPHERPESPFSANVEPFDYTTPNARELMKTKNEGKSSHVAGSKIKVCSQGVIWNGELWFWVAKTGYVEGTPWTPERGRKMLNHAIWESRHGPMPADGVIRHADGNPNNFDPDNLVLATKNDVCRLNQAASLERKSREKMKAMLELKHSTQKGTTDDLTQCIFEPSLRRGRVRGRNDRTAA